MASLEDLALQALTTIAGADDANAFLINRVVTSTRSRPHPWSTRHDYISWSGLTDRTYNARLLPAKPYPSVEALGTRNPPIADVAALFAVDPAGQRVDPKSTCLFPAFAQYLTDGFIRTQIFNDDTRDDRRRTTSNHEIDMSPLYGRTERQTDALRLKSNMPGLRGRLKTQAINGEDFPPFLFKNGATDPDFAVLDPPLGIDGSPGKATLFAVGGDRANATPQVAMINTLFLREHNRLAALLETANAGWADERVFETARNILIVLFIKLVVEEYINHINTSVFKFRANPSVAWKADWNRPNWMTAEFSLLYRWHSLVPVTFDWSGTRVDGLTLLLDNSRLIASGLAEAFVTTSANPAAQLGLGNTAAFAQRFEKRALAQARLNNLAGYNDYKRVMGQDPVTSFADMVGTGKTAAEKARRAKLAAELQRLYGTVENVEYYVGLFAEPNAKNGPLPNLILTMVAVDAFSQALTNPLLSQHVWGDAANRRLAFTDIGIAEIEATKRLRDVLVRNARGTGQRFVGMTRPDWRRD